MFIRRLYLKYKNKIIQLYIFYPYFYIFFSFIILCYNITINFMGEYIMDLKQLEIFVAVAKYQSFSKAAKELFLTQPTISAHIQNLEKELGTILVNRNNKIITLTKPGEILFEHAIYILNNCKRAIYDIKEYEGKIEGAIDIACSSIQKLMYFQIF